ncbi:hypothetical protein PS631_03899 [Pseudomonas fluorescens]|uniref:Uncharacterized protein n=1 Tax=Pseudomonas fluorescens TaxID=294 RepID=A0A5E6VH53_PSEFL|nr:hypothetical protein PS631_03899 [Pseudomonas fluorescens]
MQQLLEHRKHPVLGGHVEVDQQVATEHEVIMPVATSQGWIKHVADLQIDLVADSLMQLMALTGSAEMPLAKGHITATKGIAPVQRLASTGDRVGADVQPIDTERGGAHAAVEQRHGNRIRLFAGRARQAEDAQRPHTGQFGQALVREAGQRGKRLGITEKPGFRDDHRLDQRLLFSRRLLQQQPVIVQVVGCQRSTALTQGTLDHGHSDRLDIQADALLQESKKLLFDHAGTCAGASGNSKRRTSSLSNWSISMRCNMPWASWRTGPR